ncbi:hypothetical protein P7C70_g9650, partial [Phenoliferia sp. Uapishka_3]
MYIQHSDNYLEIVSSPPSTPPRQRSPWRHLSDSDSDEELPTVDELFALAARQREEQLALNAALKAAQATPPPKLQKKSASPFFRRALTNETNNALFFQGSSKPAAQEEARYAVVVAVAPRQVSMPRRCPTAVIPSYKLTGEISREIYLIKKRAQKLGKSKVKSRWSPRITPKAKMGAPLDFRGAMAG